MIPFILTQNNVSFIFEGKSYLFHSEDKNFENIIEALNQKDSMTLKNIIEDKDFNNIFHFDNPDFKYNDGVFTYKNEVLENALVNKILELKEQNFKNLTPFIRFLENLMQNPSYTAINELYLFLDFGKLPITEDGHFIAYKKVTEDFKDIYTGKIDNSVGATPSMPRYNVDDNRTNTCSKGLHFCSKEYLPKYGGNSSRVVLVKINPKDVVSIPNDYNNTKGRCCYYEVIDTYDDPTLILEETGYYEYDGDINDEYDGDINDEYDDEYYDDMNDEYDDNMNDEECEIEYDNYNSEFNHDTQKLDIREIKTLQEFINEFGENWYEIIPWDYSLDQYFGQKVTVEKYNEDENYFIVKDNNNNIIDWKFVSSTFR